MAIISSRNDRVQSDGLLRQLTRTTYVDLHTNQDLAWNLLLTEPFRYGLVRERVRVTPVLGGASDGGPAALSGRVT